MIGSSGNHDHHQPVSEINVTPLVDVMLVLLVIFILTAPLLAQSVKVNLPRTVNTEAAEPAVVRLSLHADGHYELAGKAVDATTLSDELSTQLKSQPDLVLSLEADASVPYQQVAQLLAIARGAGLQRLSLATQN
ncbi:MAG: biopolymer transporter ExbD [Gammaproteobacteria bacterium]|nr:biopolymer transporter ExbD [Gammaproteobacteria bacterium]